MTREARSGTRPIGIVVAVLVLVVAAGCTGLKSLSTPPSYDQLTFDRSISWPQTEVDTFSLDNGVRFLLVEDRELPLIQVQVTVRSGSFLVPRAKEGLAELTAEVMRSGGTKNHPAQKLNRLLADKAASISTSFNLVSGSATLNVLSEDFSELLPVFVDILKRPAFPKDKIALGKQQLITHIARRNDDQSDMARRAYKDLIYGQDSVYAREPEFGTVENLSRQDLVRFHEHAYQGANLLVGIVGDFDAEAIRPLLRKEFAAFSQGNRQSIDLPEVAAGNRTGLHVIGKQDVNQSSILMGHLGGYRQNPDFAALQVMNQVLSGGFSGRLFEKVRTEMGLAYSVFGRYGCNFYYPGMFFVGVKTSTSSTAEAITVIKQELSRLQQGVSREEVAKAKEQFFNSLVFRYDEPSEILSRRMQYAYWGMPPDSFSELTSEIRAVTAQDVTRVSREYLRPDELSVLVVGEEQAVAEQLEKLGPVEVLPQP